MRGIPSITPCWVAPVVGGMAATVGLLTVLLDDDGLLTTVLAADSGFSTRHLLTVVLVGLTVLI